MCFPFSSLQPRRGRGATVLQFLQSELFLPNMMSVDPQCLHLVWLLKRANILLFRRCDNLPPLLPDFRTLDCCLERRYSTFSS